MSHEATNWAIKQRGLKPTTKIVLWHLCDRFNPDYGCFPSQDRLAHDCEISRSTLNDHLGQLEAVGLLRRVPRLDPVAKRQLPTRYILGFEPGFTPVAVVPCPKIGHGEDESTESVDDADGCGAESMANTLPCPDFGHGDGANAVSDFPADPCPENTESRVRISDTNPVREPLSKPIKEEEGAQARAAVSDQIFGELLDALGLDPAAQRKVEMRDANGGSPRHPLPRPPSRLPTCPPSMPIWSTPTATCRSARSATRCATRCWPGGWSRPNACASAECGEWHGVTSPARSVPLRRRRRP